MIIPITLASSSQQPLPSGLARLSSNEVVLIELQGALDVEAKVPSERNGKFVGKLTVDDKLSKPTLRIGHHLLEGKVQNINKPLAVLHRAPSSTSTTSYIPSSFVPSISAPVPQRRGDEDGMDVDGRPEPEESLESSLSTETHPDETQESLGESGDISPWLIVGLVKKKIIFSKRPMPIVEMKPTGP